MTDTFSPEKRSWLMSRVKGANTRPELAVRSCLHRLGFRFRLHVANLPGKPDIVLKKYRTVILVNGCFWHHHPRCKRASWPESRAEFWRKKIMRNVLRDRATAKHLRNEGWRVLILWTCMFAKAGYLRQELRPLLRAKRAAAVE